MVLFRTSPDLGVDKNKKSKNVRSIVPIGTCQKNSTNAQKGYGTREKVRRNLY
jgi:hypothetical protein